MKMQSVEVKIEFVDHGVIPAEVGHPERYRFEVRGSFPEGFVYRLIDIDKAIVNVMRPEWFEYEVERRCKHAIGEMVFDIAKNGRPWEARP